MASIIRQVLACKYFVTLGGAEQGVSELPVSRHADSALHGLPRWNAVKRAAVKRAVVEIASLIGY
jgi:hypothetical protein